MVAFDNAAHERLLRALAEQLKLPLIQIARSAELAQIKPDFTSYQSISYTADMALQLIDSYLLSVQLQNVPSLTLEPVPMGVLLETTAHKLSQLARQYDYELQVDVRGHSQPVMAHRQSIEAAYASLGYAFIDGSSSSETKRIITLGAHQSGDNLVAGVFSSEPGMSADMFRRGRALFGTARQALPSALSAAGAGVFIADSLLTSMDSPLHAAMHNSYRGLAASLHPSYQLTLV